MTGTNTNRRAHWHPDDGWMGIVPGQSVIEDAMKTLGHAKSQEMANGMSYDFHDGKIRITVIEDQPYVSKIWISKDIENAKYIPRTLDDAEIVFEKLTATGIGALCEHLFEGQGVRLAVTGGTPQTVLWMELFQP